MSQQICGGGGGVGMCGLECGGGAWGWGVGCGSVGMCGCYLNVCVCVCGGGGGGDITWLIYFNLKYAIIIVYIFQLRYTFKYDFYYNRKPLYTILYHKFLFDFLVSVCVPPSKFALANWFFITYFERMVGDLRIND